MGRRKQFCPQKSGTAEDDTHGTADGDKTLETEVIQRGMMQERSDFNISESGSTNDSSHRKARNWTTALHLGPEKTLTLLMNNPLLFSFTPSHIYALQLAQLQTALVYNSTQKEQLISPDEEKNESAESKKDEEGTRMKKKIAVDARNLEENKTKADSWDLCRESPLDLSGGSNSSFESQSQSKKEKLGPLRTGMPLRMPWEASYPTLDSVKDPAQHPKVNGSTIHTKSSGPTTEVSNNPLARMSEIARMQKSSTTLLLSSPVATHRSSWQAQWVSRDPELNKDIFKCVSCRGCFSSLQTLASHMRETKHFAPPASSSSSSSSSGSPTSIMPMTYHQITNNNNGLKRNLLTEHLPMPRKLVRGQDVWLGRGEEQTRNILKCMYCGQSFRSLDALTIHMQETKHYKKVISQEQISSWTEGRREGRGGTDIADPNQVIPAYAGSRATCDQINTVLSCKVCGDSFAELRALSEHMLKENHFNVDGTIGIGASSFSTPTVKKAKSLPVKTLLEIERSRLQGHGKVERVGATMGVIEMSQRQQHLLKSRKICGPRSSSSPVSPTGSDDLQPCSIKNFGQCKSILGSLEDMVQQNFSNANKDQAVSLLDQGSPLTAPSITISSLPSTISPPSQVIVLPSLLEYSKESLLTPLTHEGEDAVNLTDQGGEDNPLAALQLLCDSNQKSIRPTVTAGSPKKSNDSVSRCSPGSILAFSWACKQAMTGDSVFKCPFCETPFVSKGAYRHHLSKSHFPKEDRKRTTHDGDIRNHRQQECPPRSENLSRGSANEEQENRKEDPESKYRKYAELARQLSSVPPAKSLASTTLQA